MLGAEKNEDKYPIIICKGCPMSYPCPPLARTEEEGGTSQPNSPAPSPAKKMKGGMSADMIICNPR
jgi:hypothetical protein